MLRLAAGLSLLICLAMSAPAASQEAPELLSAEDLGLLELVIAATDDGWEAPAEITAGRHLVTVSYDGESEFGTTAFLRLPDGWSIDDLNEQLAMMAFDTNPPENDGTSVSPTVPDLHWLYDLTLAGGVSPVPGETAQGIIDLEAGSWAIWGDSFDKTAIPLEVTGEPPAVQSIPESSVTITGVSDEDEFAFEIEGEFTTGLQIVEVRNESSQPMFIEFYGLTELIAPEQLAAFFETPESATPDPEIGLPADFATSLSPFYSAIQSDGATQWIVTNFEPGPYGMACWLPDIENDNASHASHGMIETFEID